MNKLEEWSNILVANIKQLFSPVVFKEAKACNFLAFYVAWLQSTSQSEEMPEMPIEWCIHKKIGECQGYLCPGEKHFLWQSKRDGLLQALSFYTEQGM